MKYKCLISDEMVKDILECRKKDAYYDEILQKGLFDVIPEIISHKDLTDPEFAQDYWRACDKNALPAFAYRLGDRTPGLAEWLHDLVTDILSQDDEIWIGPFFRARTNPPQGALETTHIMEALALTLLMAPEVLSEEEKQQVLKKIREVGAPYAYNWMDAQEQEGQFARSNWTICLLLGYAYAGVLLEDEDILDYCINGYNRLSGKTMNSDFYGEPIGYWAYPASNFAKLRLLFYFCRPDLYKKLASSDEYGRMLPWVVAQRIGEYAPECLNGIKVPRMVNFSDSDAMDRLRGEEFASIAFFKEDNPETAALAASVIKSNYTPENITLPNPGLLGNFPGPKFWMFALYPFFAEPRETGLVKKTGAQRFNDGITVYRNQKLFAAVKGGSTEPSKVICHQHADRGGIEFAYNGVVLLDDPGRTCYRLPLFKLDQTDSVHSLPFFRKGEEILHQRILVSEDANLPPKDRDLGHELSDDHICITNGLTELYPEELTDVRRTVSVFGGHLALIEDCYAASCRIEAGVRFVLNNRMMKMAWTIKNGEGKGVREGVGVRVISLENQTPVLGYGTLHDINHVNPGGPTQGREGSAYEFLFSFAPASEANGTFTAASHILLIFDEKENLDKWSVSAAGNRADVLSPDGKKTTVHYTIQ